MVAVEDQAVHLGIQNHQSDDQIAPRKQKWFCSWIFLTSVLLGILLIASSVFLVIRSNKAQTFPNITVTKSNYYIKVNKLEKALDWQTDPCDDFYQFACGNWDVILPRPKREHEWGLMNLVQTLTYFSIVDYFEQPRQLTKAPKIVQQSHIMYKSCIDSAKQKETTRSLIKEYLNQVTLPYMPSLNDENYGFGNQFDWIQSIANVKRILGVDVIIEFTVRDYKTKRTNVAFPIQIEEVKLPIDSRVETVEKTLFLLKPDANAAEVRNLTNVIIELEQSFAKIVEDSSKSVARIDFETCNDTHITRYRDIVFKDTNPPINASAYPIIWLNSGKNYLDRVSNTSEADLALHIWWRLIYAMIGSIEFNKTGQDLSLSCAKQMSSIMGMQLGFTILQPGFENTTKPLAMEMIDNIRSSFTEQISVSNWIDDDTKRVIIEKIQDIKPRIGYLEKFMDDKLYEGDGKLSFNQDSFLENIITLRKWIFGFSNQFENEGFSLTPIEVNAGYNPWDNGVTVPLAMFEIPFFNSSENVLNYGTLGFIMSHEIAHCLTGMGKLTNKYGDLNNQWSNASNEEYNVRAQCFVDQYDNFTLPGTHLKTNGTKTLSENLADNVGLHLAFQAYKKHIAKHGEKDLLSGMKNITQDQLFFIKFAQQWCISYSKEGLELALKDTHSPFMQRVNNAAANSAEFKTAFKCNQKPEYSPKKSCTMF